MQGYLPLTWATLDAWSRFTGNQPDPEDVNALFILDGVMLNPENATPASASTAVEAG